MNEQHARCRALHGSRKYDHSPPPVDGEGGRVGSESQREPALGGGGDDVQRIRGAGGRGADATAVGPARLARRRPQQGWRQRQVEECGVDARDVRVCSRSVCALRAGFVRWEELVHRALRAPCRCPIARRHPAEGRASSAWRRVRRSSRWRVPGVCANVTKPLTPSASPNLTVCVCHRCSRSCGCARL